MEAICSLLIACAADLWSMLPTHKSKRFHEFHAKPDGERWADMIHRQLVGHPPSTGPRYHHESVVRCSRWMTKDNLCVFHFEGNRGKATYDALRNRYDARPWGTFHVLITSDLKVQISFRIDGPPFPLDYHIMLNGWTKITQEEIDAEMAELTAIMNKWLDLVLRKVYQMRIKAMKEELVAAVWHPRRLGYLLETYGWDAVEAL